MNLTKEEQEKLLSEAKEKYSNGTMFKSLYYDIVQICIYPLHFDECLKGIYTADNKCVYSHSRGWAEIITGALNFLLESTGVEIESEQRYKGAEKTAEIMIEFAKLHVQKALQEASVKAKVISYTTTVKKTILGEIHSQNWKVDPFSIKNAYPINLIK